MMSGLQILPPHVPVWVVLATAAVFAVVVAGFLALTAGCARLFAVSLSGAGSAAQFRSQVLKRARARLALAQVYAQASVLLVALAFLVGAFGAVTA